MTTLPSTLLDAQIELLRLRAERDAMFEALVWCSGASDFQPDGKARDGWLSLCRPLIDTALRERVLRLDRQAQARSADHMPVLRRGRSVPVR